MFKKFVVIFLSLLLVFISVFSASAATVEGGGSTTINLWSSSMWHNYLHDYDLSNHVFDNLNEIAKKTKSCIFRFDKNYLSGFDFLQHATFFACDTDISYVSVPNSDTVCGIVASCVDFYFYYPHSDGFSYQQRNGNLQNFLSISFNGSYANNYCYIVSDIDVYRSIVAQFPNFASQIWYCSDPLKSFLDYVNDYNFYDIKLEDGYKNLIKFYNYFL